MSRANVYRKENNRSTGPSPLPCDVRHVLSLPIISHRSQQFKMEFSQLRENLCKLFNAELRPVILTCSGTGGLEASLFNVVQPYSRILAVTAGYYGDLYSTLAENIAGKCRVKRLVFPPGQHIDPDTVEQEIKRSQYDVVLLTHVESSTGIIHPLQDIARVIRKNSDALILVDAIGSIGATQFCFDEWGVDVAITVPQKALMSPPGLAILTLSERTLSFLSKTSNKHYYFNLIQAYDAAENNETVSTPCVTSIRALHAALKIIMQEGVLQVYARHISLAKRLRSAIVSMQYKLFANEHYASPTITAIELPKEQSSQDLQKYLFEKFNVHTSVGFNHWRDRVLRVGHMGNVKLYEIESLIENLSTWEKFQR